MQEEFIRFQQASLKQRLLISKKFSNFYLNRFNPVTRLEETDIERSRFHYRCFTMVMAIACGYGSFRFRRLKVQH